VFTVNSQQFFQPSQAFQAFWLLPQPLLRFEIDSYLHRYKFHWRNLSKTEIAGIHVKRELWSTLWLHEEFQSPQSVCYNTWSCNHFAFVKKHFYKV
jgi:hypothetical protein